jgi:hypothetical protein
VAVLWISAHYSFEENGYLCPFSSFYAVQSNIKSQQSRLTGKVWGLSKKLSDLGKESNKAKILLQ